MAESTVPNKVIKTKRLTLREARQFDLGAMHALYSNELIMQFWYVSVRSPPAQHSNKCRGRRAPPFKSIARTQNYLDIMLKSPHNGTLAFMIILPHSASTTMTTTTSASATTHPHPVTTAVDEGKLIGHAGIWMRNNSELVFMIDNAYWNQGYMTEVLETLVPIYWQQGLKRVYADVDPYHEASLGLLRKIGFSQVGENIAESDGERLKTLRLELRNPDVEEGEEEEAEEEEEEEEDEEDDDDDDDG